MMMCAACASAPTITHEKSSPEEPTWLKMPPRTEDVNYFVGTATHADTLEAGTKVATKNAYAQMANYLGISVETTFESIATQAGSSAKATTKSASEALISQATLVDRYYEKHTRVNSNFTIEKCDVFVLMSFSKKEAHAELARQKKAKRDAVITADKLFTKGRHKEKAHALETAMDLYQKGYDLIDGMGNITVTNGKGSLNSHVLLANISARIKEIQSALTTLSVSVRVDGSHSKSEAFKTHFISALNAKGYTINSRKALYDVKASVSTKYSSRVMDNHVYQATGNITVYSRQTKKIVASCPILSKGFHKTKSLAVIEALNEAGISAGDEIAKRIPTPGSSKKD